MRTSTMGAAVVLAMICLARPAPAAERDRLAPHMKVMGVELEKTTLQDAQRRLGRATPKRNGREDVTSSTAACYAGRDGAMLVLVSGERGGGRTITGFELVTREELADFSGGESFLVPAEKRPRCSATRSLSRATVTRGGLRLGLTAAEVRRLLGEPTESADDHLVFASEARVPLTPAQRKAFARQDGGVPADAFTCSRSVRVDLEWGKAVAIRASQATTVGVAGDQAVGGERARLLDPGSVGEQE